MKFDQTRFIEFLLQQDVLQFGEFVLNSGRLSPYFFNLGALNMGDAFTQLGQAYAVTIINSGLEFDVLFGPAYKGIPIAVATAMALAEVGRPVGVAYNRKEVKDHGEGGQLVGAQVEGRVLLIDDVLTSGKAIREACTLIKQTSANIVGAVIALDRQEVRDRQETRDRESTSADNVKTTAVSELSNELAAPVISIANLTHLIEYLDGFGGGYEGTLTKMRSYQTEYCVV